MTEATNNPPAPVDHYDVVVAKFEEAHAALEKLVAANPNPQAALVDLKAKFDIAHGVVKDADRRNHKCLCRILKKVRNLLELAAIAAPIAADLVDAVFALGSEILNCLAAKIELASSEKAIKDAIDEAIRLLAFIDSFLKNAEIEKVIVLLIAARFVVDNAGRDEELRREAQRNAANLLRGLSIRLQGDALIDSSGIRTVGNVISILVAIIRKVEKELKCKERCDEE
ncbi:MAG: hypothetical protein Hyperionvirus23_25 [Hyperionvirus sp.]|uniref:Uncharacterized protein n=1 Tax=Hyperionvirus sp. TaxID=2487770 RepID=A0A3G5AAU8_9VIRU|nr:MAG: hypothetical protein Hyperionvirus23_25 [Hyperionvirus sp.]